MPSKTDYMLEYIRRDSYRTMRFLGGFDYVPLHQEWHDLMNTVPRFALKAPTGHGKTTNFLYHIAWKIGVRYKDPDLFIKLFTNNSREAKLRVEAISGIILSDKYKKLFPWVIPDRDSFNKTYLRFKTPHVAKDPQLVGLGFDSSWTGVRISDAYPDDVVDFENSLQMECQDSLEVKFKTDFKNRMIPGGRIHYIYTPWTNIDLSARIEEKKLLPVYEYHYRNYENDKKLLWADYWTEEEIEKKRIEEPEAWKQGNLLIPLTSDQRQIFKREDFHFMDNVRTDDSRPVFSIDLATGSGKDDSVVSIIYDFKEFKYFHDIVIVDLKINDLVKLVINLDLKFNPHKIYFENNACQKWFGDLLPRNLIHKSEGSHTSKPKKENVTTGLGAFAGQIANRKVVFSPKITEDAVKQFIKYPFGSKDDAVMSAWIGWSNMCSYEEGRIF